MDYGEIKHAPGILMLHSNSSIPDGAFLCDGSAVSRTVYANLFAVIGTTFGVGDGSTTFNLPNSQGIGITFAGTQTINTRAKGGDSLGDTVEDEAQGHRHGELIDIRVAPSGQGTPVGTGLYSDTGSAFTFIGDPITDGVNGTPRTGAETRISSLVLNLIIYY